MRILDGQRDDYAPAQALQLLSLIVVYATLLLYDGLTKWEVDLVQVVMVSVGVLAILYARLMAMPLRAGSYFRATFIVMLSDLAVLVIVLITDQQLLLLLSLPSIYILQYAPRRWKRFRPV